MISLIVPIYKVEKHLKKCFESLINQTYQDIEIFWLMMFHLTIVERCVIRFNDVDYRICILPYHTAYNNVIFSNSSVIITDYSSAAYNDFANSQKVIYYHEYSDSF